MKFFKCLVFLGLCLAISINVSAQSKIYILPTLHGLHKSNTQYNYDSLKAIIKRLKPDLIAVEMRPEDVNADSAYLKKNYPFEMRMMKYWFPETRIAGFDWLGTDILGKAIPDNYWKEYAEIKKWERALAADSMMSSRLNECGLITEQRMAILKQSSLKEILNSRESELTLNYYNCLESNLNNTVYMQIIDFYTLRNDMMIKNLGELVKKNKGKIIVVLTGADHYPYLMEKLNAQPLRI